MKTSLSQNVLKGRENERVQGADNQTRLCWVQVCLNISYTWCLACEQVLGGTLEAGREKEGEFAITSLELEFHLQFLYGSLSSELSESRQSVQSRNKCECKHFKKVMTSILVSSPPISISHQLFQCRYSNSRDIVASSPSFSYPTNRVPWRACLQTIGILCNLAGNFLLSTTMYVLLSLCHSNHDN